MYVLITVIALGVLVPFVWMVSSSLKNNNEVFTVPIQWIPRDFQWHNYVDIWSRIPMTTYLRNTLFLSLVITFLQVLTGSFAAYGFSKVRLPGRDVLFLAYIATIAVPWQSYMVPQYVMLQKAGLVNTLWSLILLQAFGAFGVFLMRQYYETIPDELCEAARIDGLSEYGIYRRIMLPLSMPALASLALLTFVTTWNDYMGPFIYLTSNELWTMQLGLKSFVGLFDAEYAMIMTGSVHLRPADPRDLPARAEVLRPGHRDERAEGMSTLSVATYERGFRGLWTALVVNLLLAVACAPLLLALVLVEEPLGGAAVLRGAVVRVRAGADGRVRGVRGRRPAGRCVRGRVPAWLPARAAALGGWRRGPRGARRERRRCAVRRRRVRAAAAADVRRARGARRRGAAVRAGRCAPCARPPCVALRRWYLSALNVLVLAVLVAVLLVKPGIGVLSRARRCSMWCGRTPGTR